MAAVMFFIFQGNLASMLDTWLIGIVAWIAAWGGIMLVHYYMVERGELNTDRLFDASAASRLPNINWATMASFVRGVFATWLFLYGLTRPCRAGSPLPWVASTFPGSRAD